MAGLWEAVGAPHPILSTAVVFLFCGLVGAGAWIGLGHAQEKKKAQQTEPASVSQQSAGNQSPNVNAPGGNVTINYGTIHQGTDRHPAPKLQYPTLHEKLGKNVNLLFGEGNTVSIPASSFKGGRKWGPMQFGSTVPFNVYVEDDVFYVDVDIPDESGEGSIHVAKNHFSADSPNWDTNSNERAFEVVNPTGAVVFQMAIRGLNTVSIKGIFRVSLGILIADDDGIRAGKAIKQSDARITHIFKHPGWQYPGKFADGSN